MIEARPYSPDLARIVFEYMDGWDLVEAAAVRGAPQHWLALFADWHAMQSARLGSWVMVTTRDNPRRAGVPFAVLGIADTGQFGVAQAAMLAGDHGRFRRELARAGSLIREGLPDFANRLGIQRIECRCLFAHPTAGAFLEHAGFDHECDMPGFGADGGATFRQFAWHNPESRKD